MPTRGPEWLIVHNDALRQSIEWNKFGRGPLVAWVAGNGTLSSVGGRSLDALHGVYRQDVLLTLQFETEFAQHGEDRGEVIEARGRRVAWRRRRQPHGDPAFRLNGEQPADGRAVHHR